MKKFLFFVLTILILYGLVGCTSVSKSNFVTIHESDEITRDSATELSQHDKNTPDQNTSVTHENTDEPVMNGSETSDSICDHNNTSLINIKETSCSVNGYSGDTYCNDCNETVSFGVSIDATGHINTKIVNMRSATCVNSGYTGDTVCTVCNYTVEIGNEIPMIPHTVKTVGYVEPTTTADGYSGDLICVYCGLVTEPGLTLSKLESDIPLMETTRTEGDREYHFWVPIDGNGFEYTLKKANKSNRADFSEIEERIFYLVNVERAKVGASPLTSELHADYFTHMRALECLSVFNHNRPDGRRWVTVYYDEGVFLGSAGENLAKSTKLYEIYGEDYDIASHFVNMWMKSERHRNAILNTGYKSTSVSVFIEDGNYVGVQHFFG